MADEERLAKFLSRVAHDVRNATSLVTLNIEMIAREATSQRSRECLADTREALRRLDAMSHALSHIMKPSIGAPRALEIAPLAEAHFGAALARRAQEAAPHLNATLEVGSNATFNAPAETFEIVFACLFDNALDALESRGAGTVSVHAAENRVTIENDGEPVAESIRETLFEPFVSAAAHGRFRAGLGLTRARTAARRGGAQLELDSSDAHLTRFTLVFD